MTDVGGKPFHGWSCECADCESYEEAGLPRPGEHAPAPSGYCACDHEDCPGHSRMTAAEAFAQVVRRKVKAAFEAAQAPPPAENAYHVGPIGEAMRDVARRNRQRPLNGPRASAQATPEPAKHARRSEVQGTAQAKAPGGDA